MIYACDLLSHLGYTYNFIIHALTHAHDLYVLLTLQHMIYECDLLSKTSYRCNFVIHAPRYANDI